MGNETFSGPVPEIGPKPAAESEAESLSFIESLSDALEAKATGTFLDLSELESREEEELTGRKFDWPAMPGAWVQIAAFRACLEKKNELERKFRDKKGLFGKELDPKVEENLYRESMFGTVVKGWSGITDKGFAKPFNLENYRRLMNTFRFKVFVMEKAKSVQDEIERNEEAARKN